MYALLIMGVTTIYVVKGGLYSVVLTEVMQFLIMTFACLAVGVIAIQTVSAEQIAAVVPEGWSQLFFGWNLNLTWTSYAQHVNDALNGEIQSAGYEFIGLLVMMMVFRGIFVSIAGPVPGYDMQRVLATRSPREAALMSGSVSLVLFFPRYLMVAGLAVLALVELEPDKLLNGSELDFDRILPFALNNFIPTGVLGVLLAGLIAAFMSTFAASVNAGPAYIVNDIYKRFLNPNASQRSLLRLSYAASVGVVVAGITVGFFVHDINEILQWITVALFGGYAAPNFLKWVWWRFNGYGYFWGMMGGLAASLALPKALPDLSILLRFPCIFVIATVCSLLGTFLVKPDDEVVLKSFCKSVRPWGFWRPVYEKLKNEDPEFEPNRDFWRDMFNTVIGIAWQMTLVVMPIYLVLRDFMSLLVAAFVFTVTSLVLKKTWYDQLPRQ